MIICACLIMPAISLGTPHEYVGNIHITRLSSVFNIAVRGDVRFATVIGRKVSPSRLASLVAQYFVFPVPEK
jgi:hypothetical protein